MRYVLEHEGQFVRWIHWVATVSPSFKLSKFGEAMIVDDKYLEYPLGKTKKTRRELILEKYPDVKIKEVSVTLVN